MICRHSLNCTNRN